MYKTEAAEKKNPKGSFGKCNLIRLTSHEVKFHLKQKKKKKKHKRKLKRPSLKDLKLAIVLNLKESTF